MFCLTENDQNNILARLVARSLGLKRVITKVEDEDLEHICVELGLTETIIPDAASARQLADIVAGQAIGELELTIKGDARVFSFVAREADEGQAEDLGLPSVIRLICLYRDGEFLLPDNGAPIKKGDEVVLISHRRHLPELTERWGRE